jgi:demethylmenaquinone methyltransferase / 2-methoxy-6-polyprenyl-1,4-benzoquinol methylase
MPAARHPRDQTVQSMFDRIAGRYDLLNRIISFRLDTWWRAQAIRTVLSGENPFIIDLGTGTGDLAFNAARITKGKARIVGLDFSLQMVRRAQNKRADARHGSSTAFIQGSAMAAPMRDSTFDGAMSAFVLRNVSDLPIFFAEAYRILKPRGKLVSLDMFPPSPGWFAKLYTIYFYRMMPWIGGRLSNDRQAYQYLAESVKRFYSPETIATLITEAGFQEVAIRKFLCGAVCMHVAVKRS